jgi:hypothetical protein
MLDPQTHPTSSFLSTPTSWQLPWVTDNINPPADDSYSQLDEFVNSAMGFELMNTLNDIEPFGDFMKDCASNHLERSISADVYNTAQQSKNWRMLQMYNNYDS